MACAARRSLPTLILVPLALCPVPARSSPDPDALSDRIAERLEARRDDLVAVRHDLHRHPEVAGQEARTAGIVADRLRALGFTVRTGVGGHGVIGTLAGGRPGPIVALRADMDAMPSDAPDPVDYGSETPGVRHICGHDVHTTVALAVAEGMAAVRDDLPGTVMLLFQPAEETAAGARAMLDDGAFDPPPPHAIFAFHTTPLNVGQIGSKPGVLLGGRDAITVTVTGDAGDADIESIVTNVVNGLNTHTRAQIAAPLTEDFYLAWLPSPPDSGDGSLVFNAGTSSDALRDRARETLETELGAQLPEGVVFTVDYRARVVPGVNNDPGLEAAMRGPIRSVVGDDGLVPLDGVIPMFSEDFGFFQDLVPGVMYWLGVSNPGTGTVGMPHTPGYVADDEAILVGARVMCRVFLATFEGHGAR
jgi:metal-dependent amidase/aminoacylase/carboxypeptidase family protein